MKSVSEIEQALSELPAKDRLEIAQWLMADLEEGTSHQAANTGGAGNGGQFTSLPDYAARRRRIFGNKVLPNMVLDARREEPW